MKVFTFQVLGRESGRTQRVLIAVRVVTIYRMATI
jgi:hypothetical protein